MQLRKTDLSTLLSAKSFPKTHVLALMITATVIGSAVFWPDDQMDSVQQNSTGIENPTTSTATRHVRYNSTYQTEDGYEYDSATINLTQANPDEFDDLLEIEYFDPIPLEFSMVSHPDNHNPKSQSAAYDLVDPYALEFELVINDGDTLSTIFDRAQIGQTVMYQILSADEQLLALDILRPGNVLTFRKNPDNYELEEMELYIHAGNQVIYRRIDTENFEFEEVRDEGEWKQEIIAGEIYGSFYATATQAGLSKSEIHEINKLFKDKLNFSKEIQAGDRFQVVRNNHYVGGEETGKSTLEGIRIQQRRNTYTAFRFDDGNYYDSQGESLAITRAFRRLPHNHNFRISSPFNPRRLHPVTRRVSPHNGTDFAMPVGTPIVTIGDGVVTRVENHPFAGRYIEIQHGSTYKTRYLHMHRIDVQVGETVKTGQRIGLSGATGRVTGPHLHFELHINDRPVDPMTANLPQTTTVPKEQLAQFNKRVNELVTVMDVARDQQFAMRRIESNPDT